MFYPPVLSWLDATFSIFVLLCILDVMSELILIKASKSHFPWNTSSKLALVHRSDLSHDVRISDSSNEVIQYLLVASFSRHEDTWGHFSPSELSLTVLLLLWAAGVCRHFRSYFRQSHTEQEERRFLSHSSTGILFRWTTFSSFT